MSVSNGQKANKDTFNNAFMSRTASTSTEGKVTLKRAVESAPGVRESGADVLDLQKAINDLLAKDAELNSKITALQSSGSMDLVNNQMSAVDVAGMAVPSNQSSAVVEYRIVRRTTGTGATELVETGILLITKLASTCRLTSLGSDENAGVTFSVTNAGQVQYQTSFVPGTADTSKIAFRLRGLTT